MKSLLTFLAASALIAACTPFEGTGSDSSGTASNGSASTGSAGGGQSGGAGGHASTNQVKVVDTLGAVLPNARILVNGSDGKLASDLMTDGQGTVGVNVPMGGSVSYANLGTLTLKTAVAPPVGAPVLFVVPNVNTNSAITVQFHGSGIPAAATTVMVGLSCATPFSLTVMAGFVQGSSPPYNGCPGKTTFDLTAVALDSMGKAVGFVIQQDVDVTQSQMLTSNAWSTNLGTATMSATGVPLPATTWTASVETLRNGVSDYIGSSMISNPGINPMATLLAPPGFDSYRLTQTLLQSATNSETRVDIAPILPSAPTWSIASFAQPVVPDTPVLGPPTVLRFNLGNSGTLGDAIVLSAVQQVVTTKSTTTYTYTITLPPVHSGQATLPDLPQDLQALAYGDRDTDYSVSNEHADSAHSYADYLALGGPLGYADKAFSRAIAHKSFAH